MVKIEMKNCLKLDFMITFKVILSQFHRSLETTPRARVCYTMICESYDQEFRNIRRRYGLTIIIRQVYVQGDSYSISESQHNQRINYLLAKKSSIQGVDCFIHKKKILFNL